MRNILPILLISTCAGAGISFTSRSTLNGKRPEAERILIYNPLEKDKCKFYSQMDGSNYIEYGVQGLQLDSGFLNGTILDYNTPGSDSIRESDRYMNGWRPPKAGLILYSIEMNGSYCTAFRKVSITDSLGKFHIRMSRKLLTMILVVAESDTASEPTTYSCIRFLEKAKGRSIK
jgi:hypothetical protein